MNYTKDRYIQTFDLKATLKKADMSGYRLANAIERPVSQVYSWLRENNRVMLSDLMQDLLLKFFKDNDIEIIK